MTTKNTTKNITERAMLMNVTIHQWTAKRHDKSVSAEVARQHGSDITMGAYQKELVTKESLKDISVLAGQIRDTFHRRTLPWLDGGTRILPADHYFAIMCELKELIHKRDAKVAEFCNKWSDIIDEAQKKLNGLFDPADYPAEALLREAFSVEMTVFPLPSKADFRVNLDNTAELEDIQNQIDERVNMALEAATRDTWQRIHDVVAKVSERLHAYKVNDEGKVENPFRDSLIENVRDLVEILPGLNITGNAELATMTEVLQKGIAAFDAEDLRDSDALRNNVAVMADKILESVGEFLA